MWNIVKVVKPEDDVFWNESSKKNLQVLNCLESFVFDLVLYFCAMLRSTHKTPDIILQSVVLETQKNLISDTYKCNGTVIQLRIPVGNSGKVDAHH